MDHGRRSQHKEAATCANLDSIEYHTGPEEKTEGKLACGKARRNCEMTEVSISYGVTGHGDTFRAL
jgi:hypothetical protein